VRWIAGPDDGRTVGDVLTRAGADPRAVAEGRVFVGRRRVRSASEPIQPGDVIEIAAPSGATAEASVLARTADLVAVDKPAGIPTIADHRGAAHALLTVVARGIGVAPSAIHPTSRLDRGVSGVVFFALTAAAADRLAEARRAGAYERRYIAVASRVPEPPEGLWSAPIGRAADPRLRAVGGRDATEARTRYAVCGRGPGGHALLAMAPLTGRTHQLRVHASHAGAPFLGDVDYGAPRRLTLPNGRVLELGRVALHARRVAVPGLQGERVVAVAPVPSVLEDLWAALGGEAEAWQRATECALPTPSS
jgi:23S rRNA-/tRNA-specific pseudouridylate synthase